MIKKISLENFKAFEHAEIEIKPITVLVGTNNSGKTSLMQAIGLIKQTLEGTDGDVLKFRGNLDLGNFDTLLHQSSKKKEMCFRFDFEKDAYFDVKVGKKQDGELYVKNFSCNNGIFKYDIEKMLKRGKSKSGFDYYVAKNSIQFLNGEKYNFLLKNIFLNPTFYRDKFFFNVSFDKSIDIERLHKKQLHEILKSDMLRYLFELQNISYDFLKNIRQNFENTKYIGPIRAKAQRFYMCDDIVYDDVGLYGENAVQILTKDPIVLAKVERSLIDMGIADSLYASINEKEKVSELKLKTKVVEKGVNFADLGSGTAQILPIIVQSIIAREESLIIIEQPELHLHPKGQADLADFFIRIASEGKRFLLETHSDYFIERLRYNIMNRSISSENVAIYYIEQDAAKKKSIITEIKINSEGQYSNSAGLASGYVTNFRISEVHKMTKKLLEKL